MHHVDYPPYDRELAADNLDFWHEHYTNLLERCRSGGRFDQLARLVAAARTYAGTLALLERDAPEQARALRVGAQASAALFAQVSAAPGTSVTLPLGEGPPLSLAAREPHSYANADAWREGFYLAVLSRDVDSLRWLCATPVDTLRRAGVKALECAYAVAAALQGYWLARADFADSLVEALAATDADRIRAEVAGSPVGEDLVRFVLRILFPELQLLVRLAAGDEAGFNAALVEALELHRKHWTEVDAARNTQAAEHCLALGPLAFAALAAARGLAVQVRSPYLPRSLCA